MKTGFVIVALTIGLLAGGMTGASLAGNAGNTGAPGDYGADPEGAFSWTSQLRGPIETGAVPDAMGEASLSRGFASNDAEFPIVEIGGVRHRVGLDTGP